jgi:hypothetical protein
MSKEFDETLIETTNAGAVTDEENFVLPRPAWNNQVVYFRILFKVKKSLDRAEKKFSSKDSISSLRFWNKG